MNFKAIVNNVVRKKNQNEIYDGVLIMDMISLITFL